MKRLIALFLITTLLALSVNSGTKPSDEKEKGWLREEFSVVKIAVVGMVIIFTIHLLLQKEEKGEKEVSKREQGSNIERIRDGSQVQSRLIDEAPSYY